MTGVQTCALPILVALVERKVAQREQAELARDRATLGVRPCAAEVQREIHLGRQAPRDVDAGIVDALVDLAEAGVVLRLRGVVRPEAVSVLAVAEALLVRRAAAGARVDRKSTRLNSSH